MLTRLFSRYPYFFLKQGLLNCNPLRCFPQITGKVVVFVVVFFAIAFVTTPSRSIVAGLRRLSCGPELELRPVTRRALGVAPWAGPPLAPARGESATSPLCSFTNGATEAALFLHANAANGWRMILDDTMRALQHSPLAACGVQMFYSFPEGVAWPYAGADNAVMPMNASRRTAGRPHAESAALSAIYEWCLDRPGALVAYTHDKGTRRSPAELAVFMRQWDWRRVHEYFLIEVPQGCFDALLNGGYDICGTNRETYPQLHFSGNFWWARCSYIKQLEHPADYYFDFDNGFISPEVWIGSGEGARAFNCFKTGVAHFEHEYPRSNYVGALCSADVT